MLQTIVFAAEAGTESTTTASDTVGWFNSFMETAQNVVIIAGLLVAAVLIILSIVSIIRRSVHFEYSGLRDTSVRRFGNRHSGK